MHGENYAKNFTNSFPRYTHRYRSYCDDVVGLSMRWHWNQYWAVNDRFHYYHPDYIIYNTGTTTNHYPIIFPDCPTGRVQSRWHLIYRPCKEYYKQ